MILSDFGIDRKTLGIDHDQLAVKHLSPALLNPLTLEEKFAVRVVGDVVFAFEIPVVIGFFPDFCASNRALKALFLIRVR